MSGPSERYRVNYKPPRGRWFRWKGTKREKKKCWNGISSKICAPLNSAPVPAVCRPLFLRQIIPAVKPKVAINSSLGFVGQNGALAFKVG